MKTNITIALALWAAAGPLVGILLGHFLSRSWQRKQWFMEQRKDEFRELILGLADSMKAESDNSIRSDLYTVSERREWSRKTTEFFELIDTRIFTADVVRQIRLHERWAEVVVEYRGVGDLEIFDSQYKSLMDNLVKAAIA